MFSTSSSKVVLNGACAQAAVELRMYAAAIKNLAFMLPPDSRWRWALARHIRTIGPPVFYCTARVTSLLGQSRKVIRTATYKSARPELYLATSQRHVMQRQKRWMAARK